MNAHDRTVLWLAGCTFNQEETARIMKNNRLAYSIESNDPVSSWKDMYNAVWENEDLSKSARDIFFADYTDFNYLMFIRP